MVKKTRQARKQRKRRYTSQPHIKQHYLKVHLSKELREKLKKRSIRVRKGDKITVLRGKYTKKTGKIAKVSVSKGKVYIEGLTIRKAGGQEKFFPIDPSNIIIKEMAERK